MLSKIEMDILMEDSLDGGPPSVGSGEIPAVIASTPLGTAISTPGTAKKVRNVSYTFPH